MTPPSPIRTSTDASGAIPMGPLPVLSDATRDRALHAARSPLHGRGERTTSFLPSETSLSHFTSGRRERHESRATGTSTPRPGPGLGMTMSVHRAGHGLEPTLVETAASEGPVSLPHGSSRGATGPRARAEALIARARDHFNTGTIDSRLSSTPALKRAGEEFSAARRELRSAWQIIRNNPSLAHDAGVMAEVRDLRSRLITATIDRDLSSAGI